MIDQKCGICGVIFKTWPCRIKSGRSKYCGWACMGKSKAGKPSNASTHRGGSTLLYGVWSTMIARCHNSKVKCYPRYGGCGISVCTEWRSSFVCFRDWANANGYAEGLEIDRRDTKGNYEPGNCRWVTRSQNCMNRRGSRGKTSQFKGVFRQGLSWRAHIRANRRGYYLGTFATEEEAARARDAKARELHGEYAFLNFKEAERAVTE